MIRSIAGALAAFALVSFGVRAEETAKAAEAPKAEKKEEKKADGKKAEKTEKKAEPKAEEKK